MTWVAVAIGGAGALGAGATLYGANQASQPTGHNAKGSTGDPMLDPLLGGISIEALLGLGSTAGLPTMMDQTSPFSQLEGEIMRSANIGARDKTNAITLMKFFAEKGVDPFDDSPEAFERLGNREAWKKRGVLQGVIQQAGYGGFGNWQGLISAEQEYATKAAEFQAQVAPIAETIRMNRLKGQANLADIAGNVGMRTDELSALYEPQIGREFRDQRNAVLQQANAGRFNPGAALGRLNETEALTKKSSAIERALQILGGQANITASALAPAQNLALATSGQRTGATLNLANIGAAQTQAANQLAQQRNENQGSGTAAAGGQLANLGVLMAILGQGNGGGPATTTSQAELNRQQQQQAMLTSLGINP